MARTLVPAPPIEGGSIGRTGSRVCHELGHLVMHRDDLVRLTVAETQAGWLIERPSYDFLDGQTEGARLSPSRTVRRRQPPRPFKSGLVGEILAEAPEDRQEIRV